MNEINYPLNKELDIISFSEMIRQREISSTYQPQYDQKCNLCERFYNLDDRVAMYICQLQHQCCLSCLKRTTKTKGQCPFCSMQISLNQIKRNERVWEVLENNARTKRLKLKRNKHLKRDIKQIEQQIMNQRKQGYRPKFQQEQQRIVNQQKVPRRQQVLQNNYGNDQDDKIDDRNTCCQCLAQRINAKKYQLVTIIKMWSIVQIVILIGVVIDICFNQFSESSGCLEQKYVPKYQQIQQTVWTQAFWGIACVAVVLILQLILWLINKAIKVDHLMLWLVYIGLTMSWVAPIYTFIDMHYQYSYLTDGCEGREEQLKQCIGGFYQFYLNSSVYFITVLVFAAYIWLIWVFRRDMPEGQKSYRWKWVWVEKQKK